MVPASIPLWPLPGEGLTAGRQHPEGGAREGNPPPAFLQPPGSTGSLASYTLLCSSRMSHAAPTRWPATECPEWLVGGPASQFS